jgi:futalosine hydrolase
MKILIVAATVFEIAPFMSIYRQANASTDGFPELDILITGVGLTATTFHLQKQINLKRPDLVIQAGIAGCFDKTLPLGKVVVVGKDCIADEGVLEGGEFRSVFDLGFGKPNQFPYSKGWLVNPDKNLLKKTGLKVVSAVSVNQITTSPKMIRSITSNLAASTESMEGAALHYTCLQEKCGFLQLRAFSNYVGERNKAKWKVKESIINLNNELIRLLKML